MSGAYFLWCARFCSTIHPDFMLMLVLIKFVYQFHASFCIRVVLTVIYKFPFYMFQARDACDMGISIVFEFPVRWSSRHFV